MRYLLPLLLLAVAACQPQSAEGGGAETDQIAPAEEAGSFQESPITSVGDLLGEYRVAGIDGEALDENFGIALSIDGPMMSFEPTCAGFVWDITFEGDRLIAERHHEGPPPELGAAPPPVCAVAVPPIYMQLGHALDAASRAERMPDNGIRLSGDRRSVTLFKQ